MAVIGATLGLIGHRVTDPNFVFDVCWVVGSPLVTADVERVVYTIKENLVLAAVGEVTTLTTAQPNFSSQPSRMPGARQGMAPVEGYHLQVRAGDFDGGRLDIEGWAVGRDGTFVQLETIVLHNDSDGVDRRTSTAVIYWANVTGDNSRTGTTFTPGATGPVKDLHRAIELCKAAGTNHVGGATIVALESIVGGGGGYDPGAWETGETEWLTLVAAPGVTWSRVNPPFNVFSYAGGDLIRMGSPNANGFCRIEVLGFDFLGGGPIVNENRSDNSTQAEIWLHGGRQGSRHWDGNGLRARFLDDDSDCFTVEAFPFGRKGKSYVTGQLRQGCVIGYTARSLVYDCKVEGNLGGEIYVAGTPYAKNVYQSIAAEQHTYERNVTRGWGTNHTTFGPREQLESVAGAGVGGSTRILGPVSGQPFGAALADNVGSTLVRVGLFGWPAFPDSNYVILGGGTSGGRPYVDISGPAVSELAPPGTELETTVLTGGAGSAGQRYNERVHPSSNSYDDGAQRLEVIIRDCRIFNGANQGQSFFSNGETPIRRLLLDNGTDNGSSAGGGPNWNMSAVRYEQCIIRRLTAVVSTLIYPATGLSHSDCWMDHCVFGSAADLQNLINGGWNVSHCHFVTNAPAGAANSTTGAWHEPGNDPNQAPFSMAPSAANKGTGNPLLPWVGPWEQHPTLPSRGAKTHVTELDWGLGSVPVIIGNGALFVPITVSGTGTIEAIEIVGTGRVVVGIAVAGEGTVAPLELTGVGAVFVPITLDGRGVIVPLATTEPPGPRPAQWLPSDGAGGYAEAAVPSDTAQPFGSEQIYFGSSGVVQLVLEDGSVVPITAVAGRMLRLRHVRVNATGTTATGLVRRF